MSQTKRRYFVANWKSNKTLAEATEYIASLTLPSLSPESQVIICPPFPYLYPLSEQAKLANKPVAFGVQDLSLFPYGAYTGAVTGGMVTPVATYAIVGHSERRKYFHETNPDVANKARTAIENGMTPIVCIDEPYLEAQLAFFTDEEIKHLIVAYEPLSAIGSGTPDTPEHAEQIAVKIQQLARFDVPVLYGGSVTAESVSSFVSLPHVAGVLVGGASLNPSTWSDLVHRGTDSLN